MNNKTKDKIIKSITKIMRKCKITYQVCGEIKFNSTLIRTIANVNVIINNRIYQLIFHNNSKGNIIYLHCNSGIAYKLRFFSKELMESFAVCHGKDKILEKFYWENIELK